MACPKASGPASATSPNTRRCSRACWARLPNSTWRRPGTSADKAPRGAILLDYLLHGGERPELGETILLAPLVRPRAWGWSKLSYRLLSPFVDSIPRRFSENSSDPQFLDFLREHDPLQPRTLPTAWVGALTRWVPRIERAPRRALSPLVVQGESDETVDWRHGLKVLREKFDEPRILLLEEARHHLANESEGLRRRYFDFLSDALGA